MQGLKEVVKVEFFNHVHCRINTDSGVLAELSEYFTFFAPNYKFHPKFKNKQWDGKIRLLNWRTRLIYVGLIERIIEFCEARDYEYIPAPEYAFAEHTREEVEDWATKIGLPEQITPRDYQVDAVHHATVANRALLLSPTASGKSLMAYLLIKFYEKPTLLIVPTTSLVDQMYGDFEDYGFDVVKYCHRVYAGREKHTSKPVVITTWQSAITNPPEWFDSFDVVIGDEAHTFAATSLIKIMSMLPNAKYRFAMTGSMSGDEANMNTVEGLFGSAKTIITTKELMDRGDIAQLAIKALVLDYTDEDRKLLKEAKYEDEIKFIIKKARRNQFIKNLVLSLDDGNVMLLYQFVEQHGHVLRDLIQSATDRTVYYINGSTKTDERELARFEVNKDKNAILIASTGTFSTGINIPNIDYIIAASPSKSRIRLLQSIGRGLRKSTRKTKCVWYDIADDLSWKSWVNHTLRHFAERVKIYAEQQFEYKIYRVKLKQ